ncbi:hypothetical protein HDU98_000360 [Podochytrium sp. JEL0797]|nr:hypothetical protein HDU98_000360 [Podochytrium sp. JEL0797]
MGNAPWSTLSTSIYAFDVENEAESALGTSLPNSNWWCARANTAKSLLPQAKQGGKIVVMEEFGAQCAAQANEIAYAGGLMNKNCIPWIIWEVSSVTQPTDYEFSPTSSIWNVFSQQACTCSLNLQVDEPSVSLKD